LDPFKEEFINIIEINHKLGDWNIKEKAAFAIRQLLINLKIYLIDKFPTKTEIKIIGIADNIPVAKTKRGKNIHYRDESISDINYYNINKDYLRKNMSINTGDELTNEIIAVLISYYASKLVKEVIDIQPKLFIKLEKDEGNRKAIIGIRIKNALKDKYDEMNNLERIIFNSKESLF